MVPLKPTVTAQIRDNGTFSLYAYNAEEQAELNKLQTLRERYFQIHATGGNGAGKTKEIHFCLHSCPEAPAPKPAKEKNQRWTEKLLHEMIQSGMLLQFTLDSSGIERWRLIDTTNRNRPSCDVQQHIARRLAKKRTMTQAVFM